MIENFPSQNNILEEKLKPLIAKAYQAGFKMENYEKNITELRSLREEKRNGLSIEKEARYNELSKQMSDCEVLVDNVMEYKKVLELIGLEKEKIDSLLNHENAHANVTEQVKSQSFDGFRVRFYKDKNGNMSLWPSIKTTMDFSFPEKQRLEEDILVNEAPLHYGDTPSQGDKDIIEKSRKRLSEISIFRN